MHLTGLDPDATNLSGWSRARLRDMAAEHGRPVVAIAFAASLDLCVARQHAGARRVPADVVERHHSQMQQALAELPGEGYAHLHIVRPNS